jgi:3-oxoacyl-[acyl-carrier-protein] synthase II
MKRERVFITEFGVVSPLGNSEELFKKNLFAGKSATRNIFGQGFPNGFPVPHGGLVEDSSWNRLSDVPDQVVAKLPKIERRDDPSRSWYFSLAALAPILRKASPKTRLDAIVYGTPEGIGFEVADYAFRTRHEEQFRFEALNAEGSLELMAEAWECSQRGRVAPERMYSLNSACSTGNQAIGIAFQRLRSGQWRRALVGGVDARLTPSNVMNFHLLGALSTSDDPSETASRPFDRTRSGFVRGEGAALLLLESESALRESGHKARAELLGFGISSDAYRLTDPREDGSSLVQAMRVAIDDAGIDRSQIDFISAHGTSTLLNDRTEARAIETVWGEAGKKIPVSSLKSQIGHTTVAAGAIETLSCIFMLEEQRLAPNINYSNADPECDLDIVANASREAKVDYVLNNNLAFGGQNVCLVLGRVRD